LTNVIKRIPKSPTIQLSENESQVANKLHGYSIWPLDL